MQNNKTEQHIESLSWTYAQVRLLLELERMNQKGLSRGRKSDIARKFHMDPATVTRFFKRCEEDGVLTKEQDFTEQGKAILGQYRKVLQELDALLKEWGVSEENVRQRIMAANMDHLKYQDLHTLIHGSQKVLPELEKGKRSIDIISCLEQGRYEVRIALFQVYQDKQWHLSMADQGFESLAVLIRRTRGNWLELTIREMRAHSRIDGRMMQGHLSSLKYENDGMLRKAEVKDGKVRIPLEACAFYQNVRGKIRGSIPVTLACSVGQVHMPESTALLKFWL